MVLQELGDRSHLVVPHRSVPGRKRRLVKHYEFPRLRTGIEIMNQPIAKHRGIRRKRELRSRVYGWSVEHPIEQMRVSVQENVMRVAVVKRVVTLMINLLLRARARIGKRGRFVRG